MLLRTLDKIRVQVIFGLSVAILAGCAVRPTAIKSPPASYACLLPAERPTVVAALFFGRAIHGREPLSDTEWAEFAAQTITPNFPEGFTVLDGEGQWHSPRTGQIAREGTKICWSKPSRRQISHIAWPP